MILAEQDHECPPRLLNGFCGKGECNGWLCYHCNKWIDCACNNEIPPYRERNLSKETE